MKEEFDEQGFHVEVIASFDPNLAEGDRVIVRIAVMDDRGDVLWNDVRYVAKLPNSAPIDLATGIRHGRGEAKRAIENGFTL